MTVPTQLVLDVLLGDPQADFYGLAIGEQAGLPSGTIHPILARLESVGWVESKWECEEEARREGRPKRRYYHLTKDGVQYAQNALSKAAANRRASSRWTGSGLPASPSGWVGRSAT